MTRKYAVPILVAAAVLALYRPALAGGLVFYERDIFNYWRPHVDWALQSLSMGKTVAWNPFLQFGTPFLADPNFQLFYPPTWLLLVLSPSTYFAFMVAGHAVFGGLGVARLLRSLGFEKGAAAGALAFALSGPIVSIANLWHHYCGAAWIGWVLWALHRLRLSDGREWRRFAFVCALTTLAGSAETVAMIVGLAALTQASGLASRPRAVGLLKAVVVCALIASVQWLPTWRALQSSSRIQFTPAQKLSWSLAPSAATRLIAAGPYDDDPFDPTRAASPIGDDDLPLVVSPYLGAFLAPLALWGAPALPSFAVACGLFLAGSFGRHLGPIAEILAAIVPFRFPMKLLAAVSVTFAVLVGAGAHRVLSRDRQPSRWLALLIGCGLAFVLLRSVTGDGRSGIGFGLLLGALGLLTATRAQGSAWLLAGIFIDLFTAGGWVNRYAAPALFAVRPASIDFVRQLGPSPRIFTAFPGGTWAHIDLRKSSPVPKIALAVAGRQEILPPHGMPFGIRHSYSPDFTGLAVSEVKAWEKFRGDAFVKDIGRYLSLGATTAVVSTDNTNPLNTVEPQARFPGVLSTPTRIDVWNRVPRAALARRVRHAATLSEAMASVAAPDFTPGFDIALLGEAPDRRREELDGGEARILRDDNDVVEIEASSKGPGLLVLRDTLREGWSATVNGERLPMFRADVLFRAVRVPEGRSLVRFRYDTPGLRAGIALCVLGLLILLAPLGVLNRRLEESA